jgi:hypothetical protein
MCRVQVDVPFDFRDSAVREFIEILFSVQAIAHSITLFISRHVMSREGQLVPVDQHDQRVV